jgi:hypothetical protein
MEKGLGVLLIAPEKSRSDNLITFQTIDGRDTARFQLARAGSFTLPVAGITPTGESTPWLISNDDRVLTGCICTGSTRTGFQLLRETYQLGLRGRSDAYASIWSPLLERVARRDQSEFTMIIQTPFPWYSNGQVDFDVLAAGGNPAVTLDEIKVPLAEDEYLDDVWHGRLWADGNKWHTATLNAGQSTFDFFDLPETEWEALRISRQIRANRDYEPNVAKTATSGTPVSGPWPLAFFLSFLISSGFLWLAPKI